VSLTEPSNPITLVVHPAPVKLALDTNGGGIKQGASHEVSVSITRQNGFVGSVSIALTAAANLRLAAAPVVLAENEVKAKLVTRAAKDSPPGAAAQVFVRADVTVRGDAIEVDEPLAISINK